MSVIVERVVRRFFANPPIPRDNDDPELMPLSKVVNTVLDCGLYAIAHPKFDELVPMIEARDSELYGFAYEGAGMGLAILDSWTPWGKRVKKFVTGPASKYERAVYLGVGLGYARMGRDPQRFRKTLPDQFWSWAVFDGYGYLTSLLPKQRKHYLEDHGDPEKLRGYARRAFDQGLGRGLWFTRQSGAVAALEGYPERRLPDLWSGVGYACAYAGGSNAQALELIGKAAGQYLPDLALGVASSARTRYAIGNPVEHNEVACQVISKMSSLEAANLAEDTMRDLPPDSEADPAFEIWRQRLKAALIEHLARDAVLDGD